MWHFEHTETTTATADEIWARYADPSRWPDWDEGLKRVTLDGPFVAGTTGTIQPTGGPKLKFTLEEVTPGRSFTDVTKLPLARLWFTHEIAAAPEGRALTQRVWFTGPLAPLFAKVIGRSMTADMPATMRRLVEMAESENARSA